MELRRRAQGLCEQADLQQDTKVEVEKTVEDAERQWRAVLRAAEETQRYRKLLLQHQCDVSWVHLPRFADLEFVFKPADLGMLHVLVIFKKLLLLFLPYVFWTLSPFSYIKLHKLFKY